MKLISSMIQEIFKMLNQFAVEIPTLPVNLCLSHLIQFLEECLAVQKQCRAAEKGRQACGTRMVYRETFLQIQQRLLQHLIRKSRTHSYVSEHTSPHVMSESQTPVQDQRCQSGSSARNSVIPGEGGFSKNYGADQQRLQISDFHFDKFPSPATFACWKLVKIQD